jgi:hypothetical protein
MPDLSRYVLGTVLLAAAENALSMANGFLHHLAHA